MRMNSDPVALGAVEQRGVPIPFFVNKVIQVAVRRIIHLLAVVWAIDTKSHVLSLVGFVITSTLVGNVDGFHQYAVLRVCRARIARLIGRNRCYPSVEPI